MDIRNRAIVVAISVLLVAGCGGFKQKSEQQKREANENLHQATIALAEGMVSDANKHCDKLEKAELELMEARQKQKELSLKVKSDFKPSTRKNA